MLSDEEMKAMFNLKDLENDKEHLIIEQRQSITTILNLIEKQSKEIEELKAISEYREKIIKGLGLKTLPKTITGFKELIENNDKKWQAKIKAKIEELDYNDIGNFERRCKKEILQSLLEKE